MILNSPYISGSLTVTGNITSQGGITISGSITSASYATTSSFATTASYANTSTSASYALTASFATNATNFTASNILASNTITAQTLVVQTVTSSIVYSSGSNIFGNSQSNIQQMTGSLRVTGSITQTGTNTTSSFAGLVGIGTSSPADNLHIAASEAGNVGISVQNTNAAYSSQLRFLNSAGTEKAAVTYVQSTTSLNLNVNQIDALIISSSGSATFSSNIGVGGATISSMSAVSGIELVQGSQIASRVLANVPQLYISSNIAGDSYAPTYKVNGYATQYRLQGYDGTHVFYVAPSGIAGNAINFTSSLTITPTGQVNISSAIASNPVVNITNTTAGGSGTVIQAGNSYANYAMKVLNAAGDEKLRLDGNGNLLVGYTSDQGYKFGVNGTSIFASNMIIGASSDAGITLVPASGTSKYQTAGSGNSGAIWHASIETTFASYENAGCSQMAFKTENKGSGTTDTSVVQMVIRPTGDIRMTSLVAAGSRTVLADANGQLSAPVSDESVKENIIPIEYGINEIMQMNPVWFEFIDEYKNYGEGRQNGNIAQEMEAIIPEAVFTTPKTGKMGINYDQLHAVYIKAIQEQQATITSLQDRLTKAGL